jgi:L-ascorbate metabolism protein UlaG (beta-lactamase superfamily)
MLLQGCWLEQRRKHLTVILPAEGIEPIRHFLKSIYLFDELFAFRLSLEPLKAGQPVAAGHVRVTPFLTSHLSSLRQAFQRKYGQAFEAYCFLLEADSLRIGHSADIGSPHDLAPLLEKPLDLLVCELAHAIPEDLFNYLRDQPIKRILFVHLAGKLWEDITELQALAAEKLGGISFSFARDSEEIAL